MLQRTVPSVTPDSTGVEIAAAVLEDIKDPARWTIHTREEHGRRCLIGSAFHVTGKRNGPDGMWGWDYSYEAICKKLADAMGIEPDRHWLADGAAYGIALANFNNTSTHEQVIERLKAAL